MGSAHLSGHEMATMDQRKNSREIAHPGHLDVLLLHLQLRCELRRTLCNEILDDCGQLECIQVPNRRGIFHCCHQYITFLVLLFCYQYVLHQELRWPRKIWSLS